MKVMQRAEKVFLELGQRVSELRDQTYVQQERLAKEVVDVYHKQTNAQRYLPQVEAMKAVSLASTAIRFDEATAKVFNQGIEAAAGASRTSLVDLPGTAAQSELSLLQSQQGAAGGAQQALQSAAQTVDTTLQRLQQIESSAKNG